MVEAKDRDPQDQQGQARHDGQQEADEAHEHEENPNDGSEDAAACGEHGEGWSERS